MYGHFYFDAFALMRHSEIRAAFYDFVVVSHFPQVFKRFIWGRI